LFQIFFHHINQLNYKNIKEEDKDANLNKKEQQDNDYEKVKDFGVFYECQIQGFFEISELKFTSVNEHFKISKVTKKLALVKNALIIIFSKKP